MSTGVLERVTNLLAKSKIGRSMLAEEAQTTLEQRRALCAEVATLEKELADKLPALDAAVKAVEKEDRKAQATAKTTAAKLKAARIDRNNFSASITAQQDQIRARLRQTASPRIGEFDSRLSRLSEETRAEPIRRSEEEVGGVDYEVVVRSNAAAKDRRLAAINEGRVVNRGELKLLPLTDEELAARQAELLAGIPDGNALERVWLPVNPWTNLATRVRT